MSVCVVGWWRDKRCTRNLGWMDGEEEGIGVCLLVGLLPWCVAKAMAGVGGLYRPCLGREGKRI